MMEPSGPHSPLVGALIEAYGWCIFGWIMVLSWDNAIRVAISRMNDDLDTAYAAASATRGTKGALDRTPVPSTLRRPYLIALAAYAAVNAWFNIAFIMVLIYCGCVVACMTMPIVEIELWHVLVRTFATPRRVLGAIDIRHAAFHTTIVAVAILSSAIAVGLYVTDSDLLDQDRTRVKMCRILLVVPAALVSAYCAYAMFCLLCILLTAKA
jgi:hypothetical protein